MIFFFVVFVHLYRFTFGPQHPAAHGVLCCLLYFCGEFIVYIDCIIGYLHRGTEKLCEYKSIEQCLPYFDRLDYVSVCCNEHLLSLCFEYMLRCCLSLRVAFMRLLIVEFTRCFNGLLCISCMVLDLGCLSPLLWSFEERDKLMTFFDLCCGCRMHLCFMVLLGILDDFVFGFVDFLILLIISCLFIMDCYDLLFVGNRLFYLRLRGLSFFDLYDLLFNSLSGVLSRSLGMVWDCRLYCCYELYFMFCYDYCFCFIGDAFDRLFLRLFDMRMSLLICKQCFFVGFFVFGFVCLFDYLYCDVTIETIIMLFYSLWCCCLPGISFACVEHPKGEYCLLLCFCVGLCSRLRLRCADFLHICLLDVCLRGFLLHDLVAVLGNIDVVFGSVDR
uniref:Putative NADH dehydrogenase subunit 7 n=1 Tax=Trypanosoma lewisi TaxID=5695 RepID=A0A7G4WFE5_TRYLE|nr:putative NADH dehydrogenase subunit 7 [Trypanosoma lewisi]